MPGSATKSAQAMTSSRAPSTRRNDGVVVEGSQTSVAAFDVDTERSAQFPYRARPCFTVPDDDTHVAANRTWRADRNSSPLSFPPRRRTTGRSRLVSALLVAATFVALESLIQSTSCVVCDEFETMRKSSGGAQPGGDPTGGRASEARRERCGECVRHVVCAEQRDSRTAA